MKTEPCSQPAAELASAKFPVSPILFIGVVAACLFAIRLLGPPNLLDQDQERPSAYVLDAVNNGNWLCQRDWTGDITSKPPFYTWLASLFTLAMGRISEFTLYLPGALAAFGSALLVWRYGRKFFGERAAIFSALAVMITTAGLKEFGLARTDGVFAFTVTLTALVAFSCWDRGGGWLWFWLAAAIATLTKGPLGVILAATGLVAVFWERKSGKSHPLKGSHLLGIALFFLLTGGWLWLSYQTYGEAVLAKLIGKELVGNAVHSKKNGIPGSVLWQPPLFYLGRAAPWSLFAYYGFWRLWKHPASEPRERRFERFLFCWFLIGLTMFSISPHQRADLLWPIMPAGALIAGREIARLTQRWSAGRVAALQAGVAAVAILGFGFYYLQITPATAVIRRTVALKKLASKIEQQGGREFPLSHVDDPMVLQVYLNTFRPKISYDRAAELLRGAAPAYVAVKDGAKLLALRNPTDAPWSVLLANVGNSNDCPVDIVGNRAELKTENAFAFCFGSLFIRAEGATLTRATEKEFDFNVAGKGEITFTNESTQVAKVRVRISGTQPEISQEHALEPGETWQISTPVNALAK